MSKEFRQYGGFKSVSFKLPFWRRVGLLFRPDIYIGVEHCDGTKVLVGLAGPYEGGDIRVKVIEDKEE